MRAKVIHTNKEYSKYSRIFQYSENCVLKKKLPQIVQFKKHREIYIRLVVIIGGKLISLNIEVKTL